jgi:hypothetical protein
MALALAMGFKQEQKPEITPNKPARGDAWTHRGQGHREKAELPLSRFNFCVEVVLFPARAIAPGLVRTYGRQMFGLRMCRVILESPPPRFKPSPEFKILDSDWLCRARELQALEVWTDT